MNSVVQGYPRVPACAHLTQAGRRRWVTGVQSARRSKSGQHARENLQSQVADGQRGVQLATGGFELARGQRALPQQRELHLRERALHAQ